MDSAGVINSCPNSITGPASHLFLTLINTLMATQCLFNTEERYPLDYGPHLINEEEFDFIIIGAGSAGSVVANRLSANENWKVLLLEAGTYPSATSEIPALHFMLQGTTEDWKYKAEKSENISVGLKNKVCPFPRGKSLGGTGTINGMIYFRGNRRDYDTWAKEGNVGWDYDSVKKQFKELEDELSITPTSSENVLRKDLIKAYKELGYPEYHQDKPLGLSEAPLTTTEGTRASSAKIFLGNVKKRKNLYLVLNTHVTKLLINTDTQTIEGVELQMNNKIINVKARKEVVLSAGTISSPQILMNSGIGPAAHLNSLGIKVVKDLRVGENLQDHPLYQGLLINLNIEPEPPLKVIDDLYKYFIHRKGHFSNINLINLVGFVNHQNDTQYPSLQIYPIFIPQNDQYICSAVNRLFDLPEEFENALLESNKKSSNLILLQSLLNPESRGKILLRSRNPFDSPMIFPNLLSDGTTDLDVMLEGLKIALKLLKTDAFAKYKPEIVNYNIPNCKKFDYGTDDHSKCLIKSLAMTLFHPVGTCKMGLETDPTAVVDSRLKVHGVKSLRVIDASIMPTITSVNTNGPTMMIGLKGAEMIKEDWTTKHNEL